MRTVTMAADAGLASEGALNLETVTVPRPQPGKRGFRVWLGSLLGRLGNSVPLGYEDEEGFHYQKPRQPEGDFDPGL